MFDPFAAELFASPNAVYAALREQEAVHWHATLQAWVVTRMDQVRQVLADPSFAAVDLAGTVREISRRSGRDYRHLTRFLDAVLFFRDGPPHERERRTIARLMNSNKLSRLEVVAQRIADDLVANLPGERFDAIGDFAEPLPQLMMAHILGIPEDDVPVLSELLSEVTLIFGPTALATYDRLEDKVRRALDLIIERIAEAIRSGSDSGLRQIHDAATGEGGEKLANAAATTIFLLRVGSETTMGLIGLTLLQLATWPDLLDAVRANGQAADTLISEVLRLESNVQRAGRIATADTMVGGTMVRSGDRVMLLIGAANRDPAHFERADRLSLDTRRPPDLSFGAGKHACLGASLARIEARAALNAFVRLPHVVRDGAEAWYPSHMVRRLTSLPLRIER